MYKLRIAKHLSAFSRNGLPGKSTNYILRIVFFIFSIIAVVFNESGYMPIAGIILGLLLVPKVPQYLFSKPFKLPPEIVLLNIWFIWSFFTGLVVVEDHVLFYNGIRSLFLLIILMNFLHLLLSYDISFIRIVMVALLLAGIINFIAIEFGLQPEENIGKARESGLLSNPNSLGVRVIYSTFALLLSYPILNLKINLKNVLLILLFSVFISLIIVTASRKSLLGIIFLVVGYLLIINANRKEKLRFSYGIVFIIIITPILYYFGGLLLEDTIMEQRFWDLDAGGGVTGDIRYSMVTFGLELFTEHPLFGVGLNNYSVYSPWNMYSHNDYIESLTSTGIIGFTIYQSVGIITIMRSVKLLYACSDHDNRFYFAMIILGVLLIKIIGLGQIIYAQPSGMIILAVLASYTSIIQQLYQRRKISI